MTCKDCIHYDVCQYHIDEETKMTVDECGNFLDILAINVLEKQIPNKVKNIRCLKKIDIYKYGYCPKCGCGCNYEMRFCYGCGQAIDWSDTK